MGARHDELTVPKMRRILLYLSVTMLPIYKKYVLIVFNTNKSLQWTHIENRGSTA